MSAISNDGMALHRRALAAGGRKALLLGLLGLLAGCNREGIQVYNVPKESDQGTFTPSQFMPQPERSPAATVHWKTPDAWKELKASGLRTGSFAAKGDNGQAVDISIVPLASNMGKELEDVNRWRGQVGLGATTDEDLKKDGQNVEIARQKARLFDIVGTKLVVEDKYPARIVVAILPYKGTQYYFKMTGEATATEQHKGAFLEFLKSVTLEDAAGPDVAEADALPGGAADKLVWVKPPGWKEQEPGAMRVASFAIESDDGKAEVSITVFPGDVGGLKSNINRWRGQIGLPPVETDEQMAKMFVPMEVDGVKASLVEVPAADGKTDPKSKQRTVALMRTKAGRSWFVKITGDAAVVAAERANFLQFILNLRFPNA